MTHLLAFGFGYTARALARRLAGWEVTGSSREGGDGVLRWPGSDMRAGLDRATHLLISTAPGPEGDPVLAGLGAEIAQRAGRFVWVGYLSTTGVYGDSAGGWVTEDSPRRPATERGRLRVKAEDQWLGLWRETGLPVHIFRLAGIYGPGRGPFEKVRNGTARRIVKPGQVFSRIHVDDIAQVLSAIFFVWLGIYLFDTYRLKVDLKISLLVIIMAVDVIYFYEAWAVWMHKKYKYHTVFKPHQH